MSFLRRGAPGLALIIAIINVAVVYGARTIQNSYGCLFWPAYPLVIDVHTGRYHPTQHPYAEYPSPDGQYVASLPFLSDGNSNRLYVTETESGKTYFLGANITELVWSADSRLIMFLWRDVDGLGHYFITTANADGSNLRSIVAAPADATGIYFHGFSPDSQYIAFSVDNPPGLTVHFLSTSDLQRVSTIDIPAPYRLGIEWSPEGHYLVFLGYVEEIGQPSTSWVSVLLPEGRHVTSEVPGRPIFERFTWSPDQRYVAVQYTAATERPMGGWWGNRLDLIGVDGTILPQVAVSDDASDAGRFAFPPVVWADDSNSLLLWRGQLNGYSELVRFSPAEGVYETVIGNVGRIFALSPDHQRMLIPVVQDDGMALKLMDVMGNNSLTVSNDPMMADPYYDVYWSPDSQAVAIIRMLRYSDTYQSSVIYVDSFGVREFEGYNFINGLFWLGGGEALVFGTQEDEREGLYLFVRQPSMLHTLAEAMVNIDAIEVNESSREISFRWQAADLSVGYDRYRIDGQQSAHIVLAGEPTPTNEEGYPRTMFWSPDRRMAALRFGSKGEGLQLASADGQWSHVVRSYPQGYFDPVWSPDGKMLAVISISPQGAGIMEVVDAGGSKVAWFDQFPGIGFAPVVSWTKCDP
jgi:Tol biopolymer transport system component